MSNVTVACNISNGVILSLPTGPGTAEFVTLSGAPQSAGNLGPVVAGFTLVDQTFWSTWSALNANSPLITSGAVWEV